MKTENLITETKKLLDILTRYYCCQPDHIEEQMRKAEDLRTHKARWEQAPAIKIRYVDFITLVDEAINRNWAYKMIRDFLKSTNNL